MAGIDFSKFSQDFKAKFEKAIADKKIYAEEFQGFSAEDQAELSRQLASTPGHIGDIIVIQNAYESKQGTLEFYAGAGSQEGKVELSQDTISKYPNAGKFGNFNKGVVTILDKDGKVLKDSLGNPIKFDFSTDLEIDSTVDNVQGGFETIEGENFQRTNRRFAIALIRSMYDKVIVENQKMLEQLGLLNASLWREGLGMGIQKIADSIDADQKAITATTAKKIEQMVEERDKICNALEKQLDNPSGFSDEFSKLVGSNFSDMNFDKLRETCHNKENEKDDTIRYNETVEDFNEMYPNNKVTKYLEGNFITKSLDTVTKLCDSVADILVMFWTTGGIGGTLGKASMKGFANCSKFFIKDICEKNYKEAIAQLPKLSSFLAGAAHSAPTMSAFEGGKALINSTTNSEDLTADEILSRTIDGFIGGAEMGVEMAGLQAFAIAPIMNKLSPVLGKMTGASSKIKELLKKNGEMSLEDISKVYDDCIKTTRGIFAQEGLHIGVSLPIMVPGFTGIDSAKAFLSNGDNSYKEDEFREQLLKEAKTQEERVRISAMNSFELKVEFVKRNFQAQLEGMTTIEGVSLALRRFQAARLAGQAVPKPVNNLLGAKIKTVEKDGKPLYEVVQENGKTLKFDMNNGKTVSKFSSPERAIAAYQAMCVKIMSEFKAELENADNTPQPNTQVTAEETKPKGKLAVEENNVKSTKELIEKAQTTNPTENVKNKVISEVAKDIKDEGMRLNTPESLDAELAEAEQNPNALVDNMEAFNLVINGNIGNVLKAQYDNASNVFKDIAKKYSSELDQLEKQYGNDKKLFAEKFTEFLADKLGVKGIEPEIVFRDTGDADGVFDWPTGKLVVNNKLNNSKDIQSMIAHEFVHIMQFKDMIANKGAKKAISSILMHTNNGKYITADAVNLAKFNGEDWESISAAEQQMYKEVRAEMLADEVMEANKGLVDFAQKNPISKGSLNEYLSRIYQNEYENMKTDVNSPEYYEQVIENEAYYLGSGQLGLNLKGHINFVDIQAKAPTKLNNVGISKGNLVASYKSPYANPNTASQKSKKLMYKIIAGEVKIAELDDNYILDIWSRKHYSHIEDTPYIKEYMERFDAICEKNTITMYPGENALRTISVDCGTTDGVFSIGKPGRPAAAARCKISDLDKVNSKDLLKLVQTRVNKDKNIYISRELKDVECSDKIENSTIFVIVPDEGKELKGFDWSKTGTCQESGFGSDIFQANVDKNGLSTEVVFPSTARFTQIGKTEILPYVQNSYGKEYEYDIKIVFVKPIY